ncbi:MAG: hypothetical protein HZY78_10585 [Burkholderiaceae bacterium]|nr:MAG: hypothetical protein HZY78_10585 [Burkholderiaceae bacterium]
MLDTEEGRAQIGVARRVSVQIGAEQGAGQAGQAQPRSNGVGLLGRELLNSQRHRPSFLEG